MLGFSAVGHAAIGDGGSNPGLSLAVLASALTLTGYTPSLTFTTTLEVGAATPLVITGYAPDITFNTTLNVAASALAITGYAPTLTYGPQIWTPTTPPGGSWTASGPADGTWTPVPPASTSWSAA